MARLSIDISEEKAMALDQILEHGMRTIIFNLFIDDLINMCKKFGTGRIVGALIERSITVKEISQLKQFKEKNLGHK